MAIINFENMKATEPDRNFDNVNVDENYNIGLQNGQGFYGAGKFFGLVQKAVNWISTITGNKNFTGILSVNSKEVATTESVNNALANYKEIKKETQTKTFTESSSGNWVCRLDNRKIKDSLILGVKVISISNGSGADACIGIIPYRYNGYPNGEAYWGLYAIQETGKSLEGITYTLEIDYVDLNSMVV